MIVKTGSNDVVMHAERADPSRWTRIVCGGPTIDEAICEDQITFLMNTCHAVSSTPGYDLTTDPQVRGDGESFLFSFFDPAPRGKITADVD